jgi:hypothetical protein
MKYNVPSHSHRTFADPYGVIDEFGENPAKCLSKIRQSIPHSLYSSIEQLQVAL